MESGIPWLRRLTGRQRAGRDGRRDCPGTARAVAGGVGLTVLVFVAVPALQGLTRLPTADVRAVEVDRVVMLPAPRPDEAPPVPAPDQPPLMDLPRPRAPAARMDRVPLQAVLDLELALQPAAPNADLRFSVKPGDGVGAGEALVFDVVDLDEPPQPLVRIAPLYPPRARLRGQEGFVTVEFVVDADGATREVRVVDEDPPGVFTQSALAVVRRWRFEPGRRDGRTVAVRVRQTITFRME